MNPDKIELHKKSRSLELQYPDKNSFELNAEFLRVHSPSAEVRGHGPGQEVLQYGKKHVGIRSVNIVGRYALQIHFDDGHDSGIYSWEYLRHLCENHDAMWNEYLQKLKDSQLSRDPGEQVISLFDPKNPGS